VGGAEILGRLVRDHRASPQAEGAEAAAQQARALLQRLQIDGDHRVVAAALDGLQG